MENPPIVVDLSEREQKLQQRLRDLAQAIQVLEGQLNQHRTEAVKVAGQLELLRDLQGDGEKP